MIQAPDAGGADTCSPEYCTSGDDQAGAALPTHHDYCYICGPHNPAATGISFRRNANQIIGDRSTPTLRDRKSPRRLRRAGTHRPTADHNGAARPRSREKTRGIHRITQRHNTARDWTRVVPDCADRPLHFTRRRSRHLPALRSLTPTKDPSPYTRILVKMADER
jgi:hypothetical protein